LHIESSNYVLQCDVVTVNGLSSGTQRPGCLSQVWYVTLES